MEIRKVKLWYLKEQVGYILANAYKLYPRSDFNIQYKLSRHLTESCIKFVKQWIPPYGSTKKKNKVYAINSSHHKTYLHKKYVTISILYD